VQSELQNVTRDLAALIGKQVGNLSFRHPTPFATSAQKNEEVISICLDYFSHTALERKKVLSICPHYF